MTNTPGFSGKRPVIKQPGVATVQCSFPQASGKFCTLINTIVIHDCDVCVGTELILTGLDLPERDLDEIIARIVKGFPGRQQS